jgi:hypothetical protein
LEASIEGVALDDTIAIGDSPTPTEQKAAGDPISEASPTTSGPNTLLYIIASFSDETGPPIDDATALSRMGVVSDFWLNNSSGSVYLKGLVNGGQVMDIVHVTLPQPRSYSPTYSANFALLLSDSRNAAAAKGFDYTSYNLDLTVTTDGGFSYAGRAYIGSQGAHILNGYSTLRTAGHELGHNLGLRHANYWRSDALPPFGRDSVPGGYVADSSNAERIEYAHYFSLMSAQYGAESDDATKPHYSAVEKAQIGWLSGTEVQYVSGSGTFRLFRHDARTTVGTPRGIRIETPATDYTGYGRRYWLNYRCAPWFTGSDWLRNGLQVDVCQSSYGADGSIMLDMTPYSLDESSGAAWYSDNIDKVDGALVVGRTFSDVAAGIHFTPLATGSNGVNEEYIDVRINLGSFAGNRAPLINSFSVSANQVNVGSPVTFNVSASDPDGDALAYSWDFDEVQTWTPSGLNSASANKSWGSSGQYRVMVTISDMKGGVTTDARIITVGTPSITGQIWGRVLWGGKPLQGARVSTGGSAAWTGSDGTYVLTDLSPGNSFLITCAAAGHVFTPQFYNPVLLSAEKVFGIDFYANESLPGGSGTTFNISGQVLDGDGAAAVEVRAGGMVALTDVAGNYQLSNFVNGTYTVSARKDDWTFSPATRNATISSASSTGNSFSRVAPYSISGTFSGVPAAAQSPAPRVYLSNGQFVDATRAGSGGNRYWAYTLSGVPAGQFSVGAVLSGYALTPSGFNNPVTVSGNLTGLNFSGATASVSGAIAGRVTQMGMPVAGVTIQANQGGSGAGSATTDSDGYFRVENLANGSYALVPSKSGYSFSPSSLTVNFVPSSGNNFTAAGPSAPSINWVTATPPTVSSPAGSTTLAVNASGAGPLVYSWDAIAAQGPVSYSTNDGIGAGSTVVSFQLPGNYTFRARVINGNGLPAGANVNVVVSAGAGAMVVAPYQTEVGSGQTLQFRAEAWDQLGNRITITPSWAANGGGTIDGSGLFSASAPGGPYLITAASGGLTATGTVWVTGASSNLPPVITGHPGSQTVPVGSNATFSVNATGTALLNYQWRLNGGDIGGATGSSYTRSNVQRSDAGNYSVRVSNLAGTVFSADALLTVPQASVTGTLVSSTNPALPGQSVVFTMTLSPVAPAAGIATGEVQFKVDGANAGSSVALSGGLARYTNGTLSHGTHSVAAEYAGDTNFSGTTNVLATGQLINTPAVTGPNTIERDPTNTVKVSIATLLSNDSDDDGDLIAFVGASAVSANGGSISTNSGWVYYSPAAGFTNIDTFSYSISDGFGTPVQGTVTVNVRWDSGPSPNLTISPLGGSSYLIRGAGIPDRTYQIQAADQAGSTNWQGLGSATANEFGEFLFIDGNGSPQRFYRSVYP